MRTAICFLFVLWAAAPAWAADVGEPDTLTPKQIADGWILLFDGKTPFGWEIDGEAKVTDGALVLGGNKATKVKTTTAFGNLKLEFAYRPTGGASELIIGKQVISLSKGDGMPPARANEFNQYYSLSNDNGTFEGPRVIEFRVPAGRQLALRSVRLFPRILKSIFNGKDLTGWKEIKTNRTKSVINVTPEGWIHMKNGPGDLQSTSQWGDFVLQAECRTNGKELNSGIFFRCQPDKYQQGYEAQIHNGFLATPKDYTIEEFDPVTHKSIRKKKVKYAAKDYGTGAIYRRQPARFQVAKDNEWFTMTIIAQGNHYATWVNGIQVTDWTDNRPPADNARNGYRKEKGPISLQGHDPTTDLNFRNIRIAELPAAAEKK